MRADVLHGPNALVAVLGVLVGLAIIRSSTRWRLTGSGMGNTEVSFVTKQEARRAAVKQARSDGNSQVVIRKRDGSIQEERTYGSDPRRTRG